METNLKNFAERILPDEILAELDKGTLSGVGDRERPYMVTVDEGRPVGRFVWFRDFQWFASYGVGHPKMYREGEDVYKSNPLFRISFPMEIQQEVRKYPENYYSNPKIEEFWWWEYG
jgi:hypothetical protein